ncbi:MAG: hypothetical protein VX325_04385 [Bacteroidota bacterium]|nr:hypothetical protein [Bacteroidota bacterium]
MGRITKKDEYQGVIIYLFSDASSYINGAIISADVVEQHGRIFDM